MKQPRSDSGQKQTRTRSAPHAARTPKGDPRAEARRERAQERQAAHVCGPTCRRFRRKGDEA